jgi:hypothetical protein
MKPGMKTHLPQSDRMSSFIEWLPPGFKSLGLAHNALPFGHAMAMVRTND